MNYPAQVHAKSTILGEQLERIGGLKDIPPIEIMAEPEPWRYRNHIQFHLTHEGKLGFQKAHSNQTFAIRECHLPDESINRLWPRVDIEPVPGIKRISLRSGMDEELIVIVESTGSQELDFSIETMGISVVQQSPRGCVVLAGSDHITMKVSGRQFQVSANSFFQVNTLQAKAIIEHILSTLPLNETMTVLDVYCGAGLYSAFLAPKVKQLVGIEISPDACADYSTNLDEFEHVSLYEASAEDVLGNISFNPDIIVVDPPREGLGVIAVEAILAQRASQLVYISCDPATLARDAKRLTQGGYGLGKIALFDMFPQTFHLESVSYWVKS
jgi:23S rRNA (uracil1939-C5)-methyltransferase